MDLDAAGEDAGASVHGGGREHVSANAVDRSAGGRQGPAPGDEVDVLPAPEAPPT